MPNVQTRCKGIAIAAVIIVITIILVTPVTGLAFERKQFNQAYNEKVDTPEQVDTGLLGSEGFLNTAASFRVDLTLVVEIVLYLGILVGIVVQLQERWKTHDWLMTGVVVLNGGFIGFVMVASFLGISAGIPNDLNQPPVLIPTVHVVFGAAAELLAIYCLLSGHQILRRKIGVLRYWMWATFVLWTIAIILGIATYIVFYGPPFSGQTESAVPVQGEATPTEVIAPTATEEPTAVPTEVPPTATEVPPTATLPPPTETPTPTATPLPEGMVLIPAGSFIMGSAAGQPNEAPEHIVSLDAFLIDRVEVSNADYRACVDAGGCTQTDVQNSFTRTGYRDGPAFDIFPVMGVTWDQAAAYCAWAGKRLPTEAEWEYAASGPDNNQWPWGNEFDPSLSAAGSGDTVPVDSFPEGASVFGVFNMAGNVNEWVQDNFDPNFYANSPEVNPVNETGGNQRVYRGGSFANTNGSFYTTSRRYIQPHTFRDVDVGFRCAMTIAPGSS